MSQQMKHNGPNREWLTRMANIEDSSESVAVGGMASELGLVHATVSEHPKVFGRLVEFARRAKGLSVERLAERADVEVAEVVAIERNDESPPSARTVYQLAQELGLPAGMLTEVAGLTKPREEVSTAALRFAAKSESTSNLSKAEREAFEEFVKVLVDASDGA